MTSKQSKTSTRSTLKMMLEPSQMLPKTCSLMHSVHTSLRGLSETLRIGGTLESIRAVRKKFIEFA